MMFNPDIRSRKERIRRPSPVPHPLRVGPTQCVSVLTAMITVRIPIETKSGVGEGGLRSTLFLTIRRFLGGSVASPPLFPASPSRRDKPWRVGGRFAGETHQRPPPRGHSPLPFLG